MENYQYKCVSLPLEVSGEKEFLTETAEAYQKILNETAREGWEFVQADSFSGKTVGKILIFKKPDNLETEPTVQCPACRNEVSKDDIYCENCAFKLK